MAPEQAAGDPNADHRADLYAFGIMAYEMIAGEPPFAGRPPAQLLAAHITEQPRHIAAARTDIPRALADLIMRCLEKEPARRPQLASEVAMALEDPVMVSGAFASAPALPAPPPVRSPWMRWTLAGGAALELVMLGVVISQSTQRTSPPAETNPAAALVPDARSIAVLPLVSMSADSSDSYLANGITDEVTNALSRVATFRVASRTASKAAQERGASPVEIGKELNVAYLLEGTVQRQGDRIRITTRLVSAADGFTAWSDVYDRQTKDLFAVQDYVARSVAEALSNELGATASAAPAPTSPSGAAAAPPSAPQVPVVPVAHPGTSNPEAYDHFLRGRALYQRRDAQSLANALKEFQTAVSLDKQFARAHAGIASVYAVLPLYGVVDPRSARELGIAAANAALRLDSSLAEGLAVRGVLRTADWHFDSASADLQRAVALDPNNPLAQQWLGELKLLKGDTKGAAQTLEKATKLDPASPIIGSVQAMAQQAVGATDSALALAKRSMEFDPALAAPRLIYGTLLLDAGQSREAVRQLERLRAVDSTGPVILGALGAAYAAAGQRERAQEILTRLEASPTLPRAPSAIAKIHLALGDKEKALEWLRKAADAHDPAFTSEPLTLRFWDPLRGDKRFGQIVKVVTGGR
jgi:serine/threonine-protein kinase